MQLQYIHAYIQTYIYTYYIHTVTCSFVGGRGRGFLTSSMMLSYLLVMSEESILTPEVPAPSTASNEDKSYKEQKKTVVDVEQGRDSNIQ